MKNITARSAGFFDAKSGGRDEPIGLARKMTASRYSGPESIHRTEQKRKISPLRLYMIDKNKNAAGPQNPKDLVDRLMQILYAAKDKGFHNGIKTPVRERKILRPSFDKLDGKARPCFGDGPRMRIEGGKASDGSSVIVPEVHPRSITELEDVPGSHWDEFFP